MLEYKELTVAQIQLQLVVIHIMFLKPVEHYQHPVQVQQKQLAEV